jgi:hypothetical protein
MSAVATNHLYAEATFRNAQALIEREATAKLAYYAWNHRAGVPICMPFESLSLSEHQAWMDVVETVTDLVEDEPAECPKCYVPRMSGVRQRAVPGMQRSDGMFHLSPPCVPGNPN